jgi:D-amino-acid dehydrogenase
VSEVTVIGAGIAGLCAAYYLRREGESVTVLETRRAGSGASSGNAGWITPAQAGPLPQPGLLGYGARSLADPGSALYFELRQLVRMLPWLVVFARHCNERDYARGTAALAGLGSRSFELLEAMLADGVALEVERSPLLLAAQSVSAAEAFLEGIGHLSASGFSVPDGVLGGAELRELEPSLSGAVHAGFVLEQHRVVVPMAMVQALRARVLEMGVEVVEGVELRDVDLAGARVVGLRTSEGVMRCGRVVLAPGAWVSRVARLLGLRLPVQAGKGYSFEVRPRTMPRHALLLLEPHVGCSPMGDRLRIAGTMEFSGVNSRLNRRRIRSIVDGASRMLAGWESLDEASIWCGLRPVAPDGLPIIDRHPRLENVFIAGAYSMLGMTIAAPAAESLARFVLSGVRPAELEPFRSTRFGWLGRTSSPR